MKIRGVNNLSLLYRKNSSFLFTPTDDSILPHELVDVLAGAVVVPSDIVLGLPRLVPLLQLFFCYWISKMGSDSPRDMRLLTLLCSSIVTGGTEAFARMPCFLCATGLARIV